MDKSSNKQIPYGVYDVTKMEAGSRVGVDHDTARFATEGYDPPLVEQDQGEDRYRGGTGS